MYSSSDRPEADQTPGDDTSTSALSSIADSSVSGSGFKFLRNFVQRQNEGGFEKNVTDDRRGSMASTIADLLKENFEESDDESELRNLDWDDFEDDMEEINIGELQICPEGNCRGSTRHELSSRKEGVSAALCDIQQENASNAKLMLGQEVGESKCWNSHVFSQSGNKNDVEPTEPNNVKKDLFTLPLGASNTTFPKKMQSNDISPLSPYQTGFAWSKIAPMKASFGRRPSFSNNSGTTTPASSNTYQNSVYENMLSIDTEGEASMDPGWEQKGGVIANGRQRATFNRSLSDGQHVPSASDVDPKIAFSRQSSSDNATWRIGSYFSRL